MRVTRALYFLLPLAASAIVASACSGGSQSGTLPGPMGPGAGPQSASPDTLTVATVQPLTSGTVPAHVQTFTFWKQSGIAMNVPASWAAAWSNWVETGGSANANAFHAAGGQHTVAYIDPNYYLVEPGYTAPGNYPESAFGHGSSGTRTQRPQGGGTEYYLNPTSTGSQSGFQGVANNIKAGGGFDYIYTDGVSDSLTESLYRFSPAPVEIATSSQYVGGMKQLFTKSPLPIIINGYNNGNPVTEEEYIGAPNVAAGLGEECFTQDTRVVQNHWWLDMANALLYTTSRGYYAICGGRGQLSDNRPLRTYYLASWWLTYDQAYSVSLEIFSSPTNVYLFAEQMLVPTNPVQSAGSSIATLLSSTGAYMRQFGACYYNRTSWGACAAVVNPSSTRSVALPAAAAAYHHALSLDNYNLYEGGKAYSSTSVPTSLAPGTGAILFQ